MQRVAEEHEIPETAMASFPFIARQLGLVSENTVPLGVMARQLVVAGHETAATS
jgi:hypothetical protein